MLDKLIANELNINVKKVDDAIKGAFEQLNVSVTKENKEAFINKYLLGKDGVNIHVFLDSAERIVISKVAHLEKFEHINEADKDDNGELSIDEAREYCSDNGIDVEGLHWRKVIKAAEEHMKGLI